MSQSGFCGGEVIMGWSVSPASLSDTWQSGIEWINVMLNIPEIKWITDDKFPTQENPVSSKLTLQKWILIWSKSLWQPEIFQDDKTQEMGTEVNIRALELNWEKINQLHKLTDGCFTIRTPANPSAVSHRTRRGQPEADKISLDQDQVIPEPEPDKINLNLCHFRPGSKPGWHSTRIRLIQNQFRADHLGINWG